MAVYLIAYHLAADEDSNDLEEAIDALGMVGRCFDNVWLVTTDKTAPQIRDALKGCLKGHHRLIVTRASPDTASAGLTPDTEDWIKSVLR